MMKLFAIVVTLSLWITMAAGNTVCRSATLPIDPNGYFSGIESISSIGTTLRLQCYFGYQSHNSVVRCEQDGRWSKVLGGQCYKEYSAIDNGQWTPLHQAARDGDIPEVKRWVRAGYDLAARSTMVTDGSSAIHFAAESGHLELVKYLLDVDPSLQFERDLDSGALPIHVAAWDGQFEVLKYFIKVVGTDIEAVDTKYGNTALHIASQMGQLHIAKWLVHEGANVSAVTNIQSSGFNPIHMAAAGGQVELVRYLVEKVDYRMVYWKDSEGLSPLHRAAQNGKIPVVSYLIANLRMDIEATDDKYGRTPLHFASSQGQYWMVRWLLDRQANATATSNDYDQNWMPVHAAAYTGHISIVKYFVENFAGMKNVTDKNGNTPLEYAESGTALGCDEVAKYLTDSATFY